MWLRPVPLTRQRAGFDGMIDGRQNAPGGAAGVDLGVVQGLGGERPVRGIAKRHSVGQRSAGEGKDRVVSVEQPDPFAIHHTQAAPIRAGQLNESHYSHLHECSSKTTG